VLNFVLYVLNIVATIVVLIKIPTPIVGNFLEIYSMTSCIVSIFVVFGFSEKRILESTRTWVIGSSLLVLLVSNKFTSHALWVFYPYTILIADYLLTQSSTQKTIQSYRVLMILSSLLFLLPDYDFYVLILMRTLIGLIYVIYALLIYTPPQALKIEKVHLVIIISNLGYFGSLYLMTQFLKDDALRIWYLSTQIGLSVMLKLYDFIIRRDHHLSRKLIYTAAVAVMLLPLITMSLYFSVEGFMLYFLAVVVILQLRHFTNQVD
jgi:hypothetical protein